MQPHPLTNFEIQKYYDRLITLTFFFSLTYFSTKFKERHMFFDYNEVNFNATHL